MVGIGTFYNYMWGENESLVTPAKSKTDPVPWQGVDRNKDKTLLTDRLQTRINNYFSAPAGNNADAMG